MTSRYARIVARLLSRSDRGEPPPLAPQARARGVSAVEQALQARGRRHGRRRWVVALAAAAAVAGAALLLALVWRERAHGTPGSSTGEERVAVIAHPSGQGGLMVGPGERAPLAEGRALSAGSRVVTTPHGTAVLALSTGTNMTVGENSDFAVEASGAMQRFNLRAGSVQAEVTKLHPGERFLIGTPDAEVEVHGTKFRVDVLAPEQACADGTRTRVRVTEGVVTVRGFGGTARVPAGQSWPAECVQPPPVGVGAAGPQAPSSSASTSRSSAIPASASSPPSVSHAPAEGTARPVGEPTARPPVAPTSDPAAPQTLTPPSEPGFETPVVEPPRVLPGSSLAAQNDAFATAMAAVRRGDRRAALEAFDDFLAHYPASPLAESAARERARLLHPEGAREQP